MTNQWIWSPRRSSAKKIQSLNETPVSLIFIDKIGIDEQMVVGAILNSMFAYMSLFHFDEARKCVDYIIDNYSQENPTI